MHHRKILFYTFALITVFTQFSSHYSSAQILKIDKSSIPIDSSGFFLGNIQLDFNINNGSTSNNQNVVFKGFTAQNDVVYVSSQHAYILINKINYFSSTGGPFISTGYAHFRINLLRKKKASYELFTQAQYDDGRNMPLRGLIGAGLRFRAAQNEKASLYFGIGAMYEQEKWKSIDEEGKLLMKEIWKTSNYINAKINFNEFVRLNTIIYYQGGYDHPDQLFRHRVSGDASLSMKLTTHLSFKTNFTAQYEDKPIIPINNFVYALTNGLQFNF